MEPDELDQMYQGFDQHAGEKGVALQSSDRFSYTAVIKNRFVGCISGLAYKNGDKYSGWFYLTDLFVEKAYRRQGLGAKLLNTLEQKLLLIGITDCWTWTAGYEAPSFYQKQGYEIFAELECWYSDGGNRVALRKKIRLQ